MRTMKRQAAGITALLMMALALSVLFAPVAMAAAWNASVTAETSKSTQQFVISMDTANPTATFTSCTFTNSRITHTGLGSTTLTVNVPAEFIGTFTADYQSSTPGTGSTTFTINPIAAQQNKSYNLDASGSVTFPVTDLFTATPAPNTSYTFKIVSVSGIPGSGTLNALEKSSGTLVSAGAGLECTNFVYTNTSLASGSIDTINISYTISRDNVISTSYTSTITIKPSGSLYAKPLDIKTYIGAPSFAIFSSSSFSTLPAYIQVYEGLSPNRGTLNYGSGYVDTTQMVDISNMGSFKYTPPTDWVGKVTLKYRVWSSGYSDASEATVTISVLPKANNSSYVVPMNSVFETTSTSSYLLANDSHQSATIRIVTSPSHGALSDLNTSTGYFKYTPQLGYNGTDTFTYTITVSGFESEPATVSLKVGGSNYQAVVDSGGLSVSVTNGLLASYPSGYSVRSNASTSSYFTLYSNGSFTFIPPAGQSGLFTLQYDLVDPSGVATAQSVTVAVRPRGVNTTYDTANNITFSLSSADARKVNLGSNIRATVTGNPTYGTLNMLTDGTFTYVPNAGFVGTDSFRYRLTDTVANLDSDEVTVTIRVAAASLLPDDQTIPTLPPTGTSEAIDWALICLGAAVVLGGLYAIYVARKRMSKKE